MWEDVNEKTWSLLTISIEGFLFLERPVLVFHFIYVAHDVYLFIFMRMSL